jgi:hypothetical protein
MTVVGLLLSDVSGPLIAVAVEEPRDLDASRDVLALFFSEVGLVWPRDGLDRADSPVDAISEFLASKSASDAVTRIEVRHALTLLEEGQFPILFEAKGGMFRLFTGSHTDAEDRRYYQYFSSPDAPRLANASDTRAEE